MLIIRSKAPLRLGLAGGGTDVSPFCDEYGGQVLNATIDRYAYCTIIPENSGEVAFSQLDTGNAAETVEAAERLEPEGPHMLAKAVYNRIVSDFNRGEPLSMRFATWSDAPPGSGLGSSSTLIVAMIKAYCEWLSIPVSDYDIAGLAYDIERRDLGLHGGHQDQYTAAFGGINFMEFYADNRVLVNPLRVKSWIVKELQASILLYYSSVSRHSSEIIDEQIKSVKSKNEKSLAATLQVKADALAMKEALLTGKIRRVADILGQSWQAKKNMAASITNSAIDDLMSRAMAGGAYAGKVSGAGGGGFLMLMIDPLKRPAIEAALEDAPGYFVPFHFEPDGAVSWRVRRGAEGTI